jgi:hypothetical protein
MRTYEPADFLSKLAIDGFPSASEASICGLVKPDELNPSAIKFSYSLACGRWISIPIEIVETIDHLKTFPCKDHEHPLVRIKFKKPDENRADLTFFLSLISQMQASLALTLKAAKVRKHSDHSTVRRDDDFCFVWDDPNGLMICCFTGDDLNCTGMV